MPSNLTRIKNNQITDSTIFANTKVYPGSIVGSLFNSNITTTADFTITGNLTVLGSSTYLTVASTNTYVNDPLIVLNNAFTGSNAYDIGYIFNRGSYTNQAMIWNEFNGEFRFLATSEAGTTYGNINQTSYSNVRVGNLTIQYDQAARNITLSGDLAVNGGDITTNQTTFNLINATTTTLNIGGAATIVNVGATSGVSIINSGNLYLPYAANIASTQAAVAVFNTDTTAINAFGAATQMTLGATSGTANIRNANVWFPNATTVGGAQATVDLFNLPTTINAFQAAADITIGATSGTANIRNANIFYPNATTVGSAQATVGLFNLPTTLNFAQAATAVATGATTGYYNIRNANLQLQSATIINAPALANIFSASSTLQIANTAVTTIGIGGSTTLMNVGGSSGTTNLLGAVTIQSTAATTTPTSGALVVNGGVAIAGDLRLAGNLYLANIIGTVTNTISVQDPLLYLESGNTFPYNYDIGFYSGYTGGPANAYVHTGLVRNDSDYQWYLVGNIGEPSAGQFSTTNAIYETLVLGNLYLRTADALNSDQTTINAFNANVTTFNLAGAATTVTIGATSGTANIRNANVYLPNASTIFTGQATVAFANTATTTLNMAGDTTALNIGAATGTTTFRHNANVGTVTATASSRWFNGALKVNGGIGVNGNVSIKLGQQLTVGIEDPQANISFPEKQALFVANANVASGIQVRNFGSGTAASSNFIAVADNNSGESNILVAGIANSNFNQDGTAIKANDSYLFANGGNLLLSAPGGKVVKFYAGGFTDDYLVAVVNNSGNLTVTSNTIATSATTGALTTVGGIGVGTNVYVAKGATINSTNSSEKFWVKGVNASTLIYTDAGKDVVVIGGSNVAPIGGAALQIPTTDSILVPVGTTGQRPGLSGNVDVTGMLRLNNSTNNLEYYADNAWNVAGSSFTIIATDALNGDGSTVAFALGGSTTTTGALVSINGILQIPTTSYSITGNAITFTEAPAIGDVIDVRRITTTATVGQLSQGFTVFDATTMWGNIKTGTSSSISRISVYNDGTIYFDNGTRLAFNETAINAPTTAVVLLDQWPVAEFGTAKYIIQTRNSTNKVESMEAMMVAENSNASVTTYAIVNSHGSTMGTLSANVVSGNARLYYTSSSLSNSNVKVATTLIV
jgi:hypothetical protein